MSPTSKAKASHFKERALDYASTDFAILPQNYTIQEALDSVLEQGVGERIVYFYVVDEAERLVGVLPTRRLLTTERNLRVESVMITRIVKLPEEATVYDASEMFILFRLLALPIVNTDGKLLGVVDVTLVAEEMALLDDEPESSPGNDVFATIGFQVAQVKNASPLQAFRFRFPWLLATIASGTVAAILAGFFEATLAESLILAFFLTLVLGLGESVSMQSMTLTIQAIAAVEPSRGWYGRALRREVASAVLLGGACGAIVGAISWVWRGEPVASLSIGLSIVLALIVACSIGFSVPALIHKLKLDPKVAAGPLTLALTDLFTLGFYFSIATVMFRTFG